MTREQAINSMISHGFKVEQVGEIIKAVTPQFSSELEKNSKKLEKPQTFKWCTDCKEYDQEKHCCHRWSKVIRDTVEEMKQEQEPKWIPVTEKLPNKDGEYLLFGKITEDEDNDIFVGEYDSCGEQFGIWQEQFDRATLGCLGSEFFEYSSVLAWQPLPKPYEESEGV